MLAALPAIYAERDAASGGALLRLLDVLGKLFFDGTGPDEPALPGLEKQIRQIPALFVPLASDSGAGCGGETPERFLHWLAGWLAFTPHSYLEPPALRRVLANIVPLYSLRGTSEYLERILELSFAEVLATSGIEIDDRPRTGFHVGHVVLGHDSRLARSRPFYFRVALQLRPGVNLTASLERRLRVVIDFAKPAHTSYDLRVAGHTCGFGEQ
jgi:hypothetical protein